MTPTDIRKKGKLYCYYIATTALRSGVPNDNPLRRIPAARSAVTALATQRLRSVGRPAAIGFSLS
jgi:hypothetical protein